MKFMKFVLGLLFVLLNYSSCAPVKFSKADTILVKPTCEGTTCNTKSIKCSPKINDSLTTFTYSAGVVLPEIKSNCSPSEANYVWTVKRADASVINTAIPGLNGMNPKDVDFNSLGAGSYYVFLTASKSGSEFTSFNATTPLEFIVPGATNTLTCDPKLNSNSTSLVINQNDSNPEITSNCVPAAATYLWTATKDNTNITIAGLSGATSTPDIKSLGKGTYRIYLYATLTGSQHWQSSSPLTVTIEQNNPPSYPPIQCNPRINGSLNSLTLTSTSPNPLISANCLPSEVQYTWTVTKNGSTVNVPLLSGSNSNPNFLSLGVGTYLIYLTASNPGNTSWNTTTPLTITVDNTAPAMTINCSPRLNNNSVAVTIAANGTNPQVSANCNPTNVTTTWSVYHTGKQVSIAGLTGAVSTPNFTGAGLGTYQIYLIASADGYNTFVSPSPLEVTVTEAYVPFRNVVYEKTVTTSNNKVDLVMVFDDSNSMAPDNSKLAQRLQNFVNDLTSSGVDWQMCTTVTRSQELFGDGVYYWGASRKWVGYVGTNEWILKMGATDPYAIFTNTVAAIGAGWAGTDDERGIKAAWWNIDYADYNFCHRPDASLSVIAISDEDERSVGGDSSQVYYSGELKFLEADDTPQGFISKVKQTFGNDKRFTFNSIIVKPGDSDCMTEQDAVGSKSHYGYKYSELSQLTNGAVGSICANDYSSNLYYFKDRIINSLASVPLECAPVGDIGVTITPTMNGVSAVMQNNNLVFSPAIPAGRTIKLEYKCAAN